jgi:predicted transposase/invertase (TIGR01784 family)
MANNDITHPPDRFFKSVMSNPKTTKEFFEQHLPANIRSSINLDTINYKNESYIDSELRLQLVDVLYSAEFNGKAGYLYLLIEHQSNPQELMPLRILKYMVAIMEDHIKKTETNTLPIVYPMILYSGWKNYNYSTDLFDLFGENKELAQDIFWRPYKLIDLSKISDDELTSSIWFGVAAYVMKHVFEKDLKAYFKNVVELLKPIDKENNVDYICKIISYVAEVTEIDKEVFVETIKNGLKTLTEDKIMTLAEQFKQEGRQEGRQEGMHAGELKGKAEGKAEALKAVAISLFGQGMTIEQTGTITGLSASELEKLKAKNSN